MSLSMKPRGFRAIIEPQFAFVRLRRVEHKHHLSGIEKIKE